MKFYGVIILKFDNNTIPEIIRFHFEMAVILARCLQIDEDLMLTKKDAEDNGVLKDAHDLLAGVSLFLAGFMQIGAAATISAASVGPTLPNVRRAAICSFNEQIESPH